MARFTKRRWSWEEEAQGGRGRSSRGGATDAREGGINKDGTRLAQQESRAQVEGGITGNFVTLLFAMTFCLTQTPFGTFKLQKTAGLLLRM